MEMKAGWDIEEEVCSMLGVEAMKAASAALEAGQPVGSEVRYPLVPGKILVLRRENEQDLHTCGYECCGYYPEPEYTWKVVDA